MPDLKQVLEKTTLTYLVQVLGTSAETEDVVGGDSDSKGAYKCKYQCEEFIWNFPLLEFTNQQYC